MALFPHALGRDGFSPVFSTLLSCISWLVTKTRLHCSGSPAGSWQPSSTLPPSQSSQRTSTASLSAVKSAPGCPVSSGGDPRCHCWAAVLAVGHWLSPLWLVGRKDLVVCLRVRRWGSQLRLCQVWSQIWEPWWGLAGDQSCWMTWHHYLWWWCWRLLCCAAWLCCVLGTRSSVNEKTFLWRSLGAGTCAQPCSLCLALTAQSHFSQFLLR